MRHGHVPHCPAIGHVPGQKSASQDTKPVAIVDSQPSRKSVHERVSPPGPSQNAQVRSHKPAIGPVETKSTAQLMKPDVTMWSQPSRTSVHGAAATSVSETPFSCASGQRPAA